LSGELFTFQALDEFVDILDGWGSESNVEYQAKELGPLLELEHAIQGGFLPQTARSHIKGRSQNPVLYGAESHWISESKRYGMMRLHSDTNSDQNKLATFIFHAKQSATKCAGLTNTVSGQLCAFIEEMETNVREHSQSIETGMVAFAARKGCLEIVIMDQGRGILNSLLENKAYRHLRSEGEAMSEALKPGVSRFEADDRGMGFLPLLRGVARLNSVIRMRSGDAALIMSGTPTAPAQPQISQKPKLQGFFISVKCCEPRTSKKA
tara:strand:- start:1821 stop:2618 length:798 start_codon:yes stop_codon:yes gene_type:complete